LLTASYMQLLYHSRPVGGTHTRLELLQTA
jgi:hypothetical protein